MGLRLGEAPKGWFSVTDNRYFNGGAVMVFLQILLIFVLAAVYSPDPWLFFFQAGMIPVYITVAIVLLLVIAVVHTNSATGEEAVFGRSFRVRDPETLVEDVEKVIPLQYRPVQRTTEKEDVRENDETLTETLKLKESLGFQYTLVLTIKPKRHYVQVLVKVSDRDARETEDLLGQLLDFFEGRRMDWLSVDIDEDAGLLMGEGKDEILREGWSNPFSLSFNRNAALLVVVILIAFWLVIVYAILHPWDLLAMVFAVVGMMLSFLLVAILIAIVQEDVRMGMGRYQYEYSRRFHASPWYVTAAIQEGLETVRWPFTAKSRVDPTDRVKSECFEIPIKDVGKVTIDVAWDDVDTDPNWSSVRIRTPTELENVKAIQDLVRKSVYGRYKRLGL